MNFKAVWLCLLLISSALSPRLLNAQGQLVYGTVTGIVTDPTGAVVPNANVSLTNVTTGVSTASQSNHLGLYTIPNLIAGSYNLTVSVPGFRELRELGISVSVGNIVRKDVKLVVGAETQQIVVNSQAAQLKTETVDTGGVIGGHQLQELPTQGMNPTALTQLFPGVVQSPGQTGDPSSSGTGFYSVQVNGQPSGENSYKIDGTDDNDGIDGRASLVPNTDALQEVTVQTSNYDVEIGRVAGAAILMTTKSGTNAIHGSLFEYNRVNAMFSGDPFSGPPGHYVYNQYGGGLGGPVIKDKLFYYGHFQGVNVRSGGNVLTTVPTEAMRTGDFSSLPYTVYDPTTGGADGSGRTPFAGNMIPQDRIDPAATNLLALVPLPNRPGTDNNYIGPAINNVDEYLYAFRVDYNINEENRLFVRYNFSNQNQVCGGVLGPAIGAASSTCGLTFIGTGSNDNLTLDYTHTIGTRWLFEGRFGWNLRLWQWRAQDQNKDTNAQIGIPGINDACSECGGLAEFDIGGPTGSTMLGNNTHSRQIDDYGNFDYVGTATWTKGAHAVKFGGEVQPIWRNRRDLASHGQFQFSQNITASADDPGSGLGIASLLLGTPSNFNQYIYSNELPHANQHEAALYGQDLWHVSPKLVLNLGLRWDFMGQIYSNDPGTISNFNFANTNVVISSYGGNSNSANIKSNWGNFGPRVGFAYLFNPRTVLRAGYGRSFSDGYSGSNFGALTDQWPNLSQQNLVQTDPYTPVLNSLEDPKPPFVSGFEILQAAGNPAQYPIPRTDSGLGVSNHNPTISVSEWNVTLEQSFSSNVTVGIGYLGNVGRHLFYRINENSPPPGPGSYNYPYAAFDYTQAATNQNNQSNNGYNALQVQVKKNYTKGLLLTGAFTWSKSYDFGTMSPLNPFNMSSNRGPEDSDRQIVATISHVWDLPFGPGQRFANSTGPLRFLVGGWQWSGISSFMTGTPTSPYVSNGAAYLNSSCCTLLPNLVGSPIPADRNRYHWFNASAYQIPALYTFGDAGRNSLRDPGFNEMDWSLTKKFLITESLHADLRWEVFNVFNRTNLGSPNTAIDQPTFGQIFGTGSYMRRQQVGLHVSW
jgi:outer membrane receptor protein involved in Fe transport